jgi:DNA-binding response OmpR family regulator
MAIKVLIVEDDPMLRRMYDTAFNVAEFEVTKAEDGTIVTETASLNPPDVIILDMMMPNFNGLDTLKELQTSVQTRGIPVLILSAYDDPELVAKALKAGASRYLSKNEYDPEQLVKIVREVATSKKTNSQ